MYGKSKDMFRPVLVFAALAAAMATAHGQELPIDTIVNRDGADVAVPLSEQDMEQATPLPAEETTPEELNRMRQRFRDLNPNVLDLVPEQGLREREVDGVPVRVRNPAGTDPFWSVGRLIFRKKSDGRLYLCSAQVTNDLKIILTAAHCVYDAAGNDWNTDFTFQRAYDDGSTPQTIGWRCASIYRAYHSPSKNYAYDYAFILAQSNNEKPSLDLAIGTPTNSNLTAVGYPSNFGNNRQMFRVDGRWASVSGGIVTMRGNPMRSGNSGGAWFTSFKEGGGTGDNRVISVNSHHIVGNTTDENGPLFTTQTTNLLRQTLTCG